MVHTPRKTRLWVVLLSIPYMGLSRKFFIQSNNPKKSPDYGNYPQKVTGYPQHNRINI